MKKKLCTILLVLIFGSHTLVTQAQVRYKITDADVRFFAGTALEDIDATSDKLVGVVDAENKSFAFRMAMNTFKFRRELMQEHFNENYLETEKYPNAEFKGKIEGDFDLTQKGEYPVKAKGIFNIHNVEKEYTIDAVISVSDSGPSLHATFPVLLEDHDIERPSVVMIKIAEKADVTVTAHLTKL